MVLVCQLVYGILIRISDMFYFYCGEVWYIISTVSKSPTRALCFDEPCLFPAGGPD